MNSRGRIRQYVIKKSAFIFPTILGITFLIFLLMNYSASTSTQSENIFYKNISGITNILKEYFEWIKNVFTLDFGKSLRDGRPVWDKIIERLPATLELNVSALLMTIIIGIPLGVWQAYRINSKVDKSLTIITFIFYSIPAFWLGLILVILLGVILPDITKEWFGISLGLPTSERRSLNFILYPNRYSFFQVYWDRFLHILIPAFTFSVVNIATIARYVRANMILVLKEDYIVTARSKGLSEKKVLFKHALKNSIISTVTFISFLIPSIIGSSFIIEVVFSWPGIGRLGYNSILARDYPVVMAIGLIIAIITLFSNLCADILYYYLDPRIRVKK
ncbi:MAG: ABC transporter permease [Candidatus Muirbacterium halophilum]|nr:ABC transporter permease [Candidatus Muirbacterium halophilum]MCK9475022.1 ABC transporter permease [Candidatus Muirbacterium halophilum]